MSHSYFSRIAREFPSDLSLATREWSIRNFLNFSTAVYVHIETINEEFTFFLQNENFI